MRTLKVKLTESGIDSLIHDLEAYRDSLDSKVELFTAKLLELGIARAESVPGISGEFGTHKMERFVWYSKELNPSKDGCLGVLVGTGRTFNVTWGENGEKSGSLNALQAIEFGTAAKALPVQTRFGVTGGRGTNSYYGHSDDSRWYFANGKDSEGRLIWKKATAITPTRPMAQAANEMISQINRVAKEVFGQ